MKSGRKIYATLEPAEDCVAAIRALGNGDLRSLVHYITKAKRATPGTTGEMILATAMVDGFHRWMAKGKGKGL